MNSINPFPNKDLVLRVCNTSLLKSLGKREIAHDKNFSFPKCFEPFWRTFHQYHEIWNCRLQTLFF